MGDRRLRWKKDIPAEILRAGAAAGETIAQIRDRLSRAGIVVTDWTIRYRVDALGIARPRRPQTTDRARIGVTPPPRDVPEFTREDARTLTGNARLLGRERQARDRLLRRGQRGNPRALRLLWERYHLRLPLVEQKLAGAQGRRGAEEKAA
jgi:hypothetical protein